MKNQGKRIELDEWVEIQRVKEVLAILLDIDNDDILEKEIDDLGEDQLCMLIKTVLSIIKNYDLHKYFRQFH